MMSDAGAPDTNLSCPNLSADLKFRSHKLYGAPKLPFIPEFPKGLPNPQTKIVPRVKWVGYIWELRGSGMKNVTLLIH